MDLLQSFKEFTATQHLFAPTDKLLLAVSGGVDSVVLCELCHQAGLDFIIAHCNFQLREDESERDETFVRQLAQKYNRPVLVKRMETVAYAAQHQLSIQVAARELRYSWFRELTGRPASGASEQSSSSSSAQSAAPTSSRHTREPSAQPPSVDPPPSTPRWILTAHHLDDNIETLLMNFFKGTGIAGLRAILPRQGNIVRPLLFTRKESLHAFAAEQKLSWVEDGSNDSDKYTRNYFRHQVIPLIQQVYPGAANNLADNIARFREIEILYQQSVQQHKKKLLEYKGQEIHIPVLKLKKSVPLPTLVYEIITEFGFSPQQVDGVIDLLSSESGKYIRSSTHRILKNRNWLIISAHPPIQSSSILIESADDKVIFENGELRLELSAVGSPISPNPLVAQLDAEAIRFPLLLRRWRPGDYFYPLGMRKKKKVSRFFIDNKLSLADKEKVWVIEMNKKIIWVVGLRIDDRFRITPQTARVLKIESRML
ncbi:MAG TPA: tRNA lysidine(34) synthetase TilS [Puia sp.]|nr:tRNA lysidine(34) synthetase TilS [Puia sp.]